MFGRGEEKLSWRLVLAPLDVAWWPSVSSLSPHCRWHNPNWQRLHPTLSDDLHSLHLLQPPRSCPSPASTRQRLAFRRVPGPMSLPPWDLTSLAVLSPFPCSWRVLNFNHPHASACIFTTFPLEVLFACLFSSSATLDRAGLPFYPSAPKLATRGRGTAAVFFWLL